MSEHDQPAPPRRGRPPKAATSPDKSEAETVVFETPPPVRRHTPEAGIKDYGVSLDEISARQRPR